MDYHTNSAELQTLGKWVWVKSVLPCSTLRSTNKTTTKTCKNKRRNYRCMFLERALNYGLSKS